MTRADPAVLTEDSRTGSGLTVYAVPSWRERFGLAAGLATGPPRVDFGLQSPRAAAEVLQRWLALPDAVGGGFAGVAVSRQIHEAHIARHERAHNGLLVQQGFDGHVSSVAGVLLALTVADCVPVYLTAPGAAAWGLIHAGWRGVAGGIVEAGVSSVAELAGCRPGDIVMHCGISICGDCYEVGSEVVAAVTGRRVSGTARLDLRRVIAERAGRLGLSEVTVSDWCTAHHADRYYSHRASGGSAGRMAAYLGRPA